MADTTKIEWVRNSDGTPGATFNPWVGCTKISPACDNCYAESWAKRSGLVQWGNNPRRRTSAANWRKPLKWNREAEEKGIRIRVFCASLSDWLDNHPSITREMRADLWETIDATPNLDWLMLTKRPQNFKKYRPENYGLPAWGDGWRNVWLGTTIENRKEGQRRAWELAQIPAAVRFWSCEPLLEDLGDCTQLCLRDTAEDGRPAVSWVISGGESGPGARPSHPDWFRNLRDQCKDAGVAFFFKQNGDWAPVGWVHHGTPFGPAGHTGAFNGDGRFVVDRDGLTASNNFEMRRVGKARAGRLLDGRTHDEMPATEKQDA